MPLEPEFMKRHDAFDADRSAVKTVDDWEAFSARWFPTRDWPRKSAADLAAEAPRKRGPVALGQRKWWYTYWTYDLTPEARYEYFYTVATVGDPLRFPVAEVGVTEIDTSGAVGGQGSARDVPDPRPMAQAAWRRLQQGGAAKDFLFF